MSSGLCLPWSAQSLSTIADCRSRRLFAPVSCLSRARLLSPRPNYPGFPPRLIAFFSLLLFILFFTGSLPFGHSSSSSVHSHHGFTQAHLLTPHDYLNASLSDPAPFAFCPVYGPGDEVANRRGQTGLLKSKIHTGTGARMQRVVRKALSGAPLTISVLGASSTSSSHPRSLLSLHQADRHHLSSTFFSVSACHGAGDDPISARCYPSKFFSWWNEFFPHPASELTNGAARNADSSYFAFCSEHHLPDKTDLVILEFDAADPKCVCPFSAS